MSPIARGIHHGRMTRGAVRAIARGRVISCIRVRLFPKGSDVVDMLSEIREERRGRERRR